MTTCSIAPLPESTDTLLVTLRGPADAETILALMADLERRSPARVLVDESELGVGLVGPHEIQRMAESWREARALPTAFIAVVAPNVVIYGLNRMFQGLADAMDRVAIFTDRAEAMRWLESRGPAAAALGHGDVGA